MPLPRRSGACARLASTGAEGPSAGIVRILCAARAVTGYYGLLRIYGAGLSNPHKHWQIVEGNWLGGRDSNPDTQIQSLKPPADSKADQQPNSADSGKVRQNPQPRRNQDSPNIRPGKDDQKRGGA